MAPRIKKWLSLPFLGGGGGISPRNNEKKYNETDGRDARRHHDQEGDLTKHESAADFAKKGEDEIIQDYNAPIHWCDDFS